jgi:hypothetical protein
VDERHLRGDPGPEGPFDVRLRALVEERHARPFPQEEPRGGNPRRSGADHEDVFIGEGFHLTGS